MTVQVGGVASLQDNLTVGSNISVWPNPVDDYITVSNMNTDFIFKLASIEGKIVKKGTINNNDSQTIDVQDVPKGIYILHLQSKVGTKILRVQVQ